MNIQIVPGYASKEFQNFLGTAFLWCRTKEGVLYWEKKFCLQDKITVEDIEKIHEYTSYPNQLRLCEFKFVTISEIEIL